MNKNFTSKFLKGSVATSVGSIFSMVFHFISIMILTRIIPEDDFGIYILILVTVHLINIFTGLGLNLTLVKFIASDNLSEKKAVLVSVLFTRVIILLFFSLVFYAGSHFILNLFGKKLADFLLYIPVLFILASFRDLFYNLLQGLNLFKKFAVIQITSALFKIAAILVVLGFHKLSLNNLIFIEIYTSLFCVILQLLLLPIKTFDFSRPDFQVYKKIMKFSFPLYLNNICNFIFERINIFIIGASLTPVSIAYFDVADKIPQALKKMFNSFIIVYFPTVSKLFSQDKKSDAQNLMNKSLGVFSLGITFLLLISFLFKDEIITLIFSKKYLHSATAFSLLILAFYLKAITNIIGHSIVAAGFSSIPVRANFISSGLGAIGSLIMIPAYGFIGAVYSILLMNVISLFIHYLYSFKLKIYPNPKKFLTPVFVVLLIIFSSILLEEINFITKFLFLMSYLIISWFFIEDVQKISKFVLKPSQIFK